MAVANPKCTNPPLWCCDSNFPRKLTAEVTVKSIDPDGYEHTRVVPVDLSYVGLEPTEQGPQWISAPTCFAAPDPSVSTEYCIILSLICTETTEGTTSHTAVFCCIDGGDCEGCPPPYYPAENLCWAHTANPGTGGSVQCDPFEVSYTGAALCNLDASYVISE